MPFTFFSPPWAGGRKRVDPTRAEEGGEGRGEGSSHVDEQALKVRLVSVLHRIESSDSPGVERGFGGGGGRRTLIDACDSEGCGVLHLLALLDWLPQLALALHVVPHPTPRDRGGRSPLQLALAADRRLASAMLLLSERRGQVPWPSVWALAAERRCVSAVKEEGRVREVGDEVEAESERAGGGGPVDDLDLMVEHLSQQAKRDLHARRIVEMKARVSLSAYRPSTPPPPNPIGKVGRLDELNNIPVPLGGVKVEEGEGPPSDDLAERRRRLLNVMSRHAR